MFILDEALGVDDVEPMWIEPRSRCSGIEINVKSEKFCPRAQDFEIPEDQRISGK